MKHLGPSELEHCFFLCSLRRITMHLPESLFLQPPPVTEWLPTDFSERSTLRSFVTHYCCVSMTF